MRFFWFFLNFFKFYKRLLSQIIKQSRYTNKRNCYSLVISLLLTTSEIWHLNFKRKEMLYTRKSDYKKKINKRVLLSIKCLILTWSFTKFLCLRWILVSVLFLKVLKISIHPCLSVPVKSVRQYPGVYKKLKIRPNSSSGEIFTIFQNKVMIKIKNFVLENILNIF